MRAMRAAPCAALALALKRHGSVARLTAQRAAGSLAGPARSARRAAAVVRSALLLRRLAVAAAALAGLAGGTLSLSAPVQAATAHEYLSQITAVPAEGPHGEPVPAPGKLSGVDSMTVDSGELFLTEKAEGGSSRSTIDRFNASSGAFELQFPQAVALEYIEDGVAVGPTPADRVYVGAEEFGTSEGVVGVFDASGDLLETWKGEHLPGGSFGGVGAVNGVAVDDSASGSWANGDVYVADWMEGKVDVFKPLMAGKGEPELITQLEAEPGVPFVLGQGGAEPDISVDQINGDLLVVNNEDVVDVFEPTGLDEFTLVRRLTGTETPAGAFQRVTGVTVDGQNGHIYAADRGADAVDEFNAAGEYLDQLTGTPSGAFESVRGVAVDPASGYVYVGDTRSRGGVVDVFGPSIIVPDVTVAEHVTELSPTGATFHGTVNPEEAGETTCEFEYGTSTAYGQSAQCTGPGNKTSPIPNGNQAVAVQSAPVTGLVPDTTYHFRLDASAAGHTTTGECPADCGQFTTSGPGIDSESVSGVAATSATLEATIDPHEEPTSYYFQYSTEGTEACSLAHTCTQAPAAPGPSIGSGSAEVTVSPQYLEGLSPATLYHYRVVAVSEIEGTPREIYGPDQTFATQAVSEFALPDSRQWEMVSPPNMHGANIEPIGLDSVIQASVDGNAFTYATNGPTESEPQGSQNIVQVLATRGAGGSWSSRDISVPRESAPGPSIREEGEYRFFSEANLSSSVLQPFGSLDRLLSPAASEPTAFLATDYVGENEGCSGADCYTPLVTGCPPQGTPCAPAVSEHANVKEGTLFGEQNCTLYGGTAAYCGPKFVGATPELSHIVLQSTLPLTPNAPPAGTGGEGALYEWSDGALAPVSILPPGEGGNGIFGELGGKGGHDARHAISSDGSRVVFTAVNAQGETALYVRDMLAGETGETIRLDVLQPGASSQSQPPEPAFQDASSDGSRVFFTDTEPLTEDSGASYQSPDLYECEIPLAGKLECKLTDLTPLGAGENAAHVQVAVIGASEDGSYVYFVADGVLAPGAEPGSCESGFATSGTCNLYVNHDGKTTFIAGLSSEDVPDWANGGSELRVLSASVSPNGRWLAFLSDRNLTGYDTADARSGHADEEVYLYDAHANGGAGSLICASCDPSGARPVGREYGSVGENIPLVGAGKIWESTNWLAGDLPGWTAYENGETARRQSRYLSNSGRLFFNAFDALVPQDVNGTWDVYEYEPPGVGSCNAAQLTYSERTGGCVGLISSGSSTEESAFLDASATGGRDAEGDEGGGDVFFMTASQLAPADTDTSIDVYDAHECTSAEPCPPAASTPSPECSNEASCKAAVTPQPAIFGAPASANVAGSGNVPPAPKAKPKSAAQVRAEALAKALKACRRKHDRHKRRACEAQARRRYGPAHKASKSSRTRRAASRGRVR